MAFNLKKINENAYEYINKQGVRKVFDKAKLNQFVSAGKEIFVDGQRWLLKPEATVPVQQPASQAKKTYNFTTNDNVNFSIGGKSYGIAVVLKNLAKGVDITINGKPVKLSDDRQKIEYIDEENKELSSSKTFTVNKQNVDAMINAAPANSAPTLAIAVTTDAEGNYIYNGKKVQKESIISTLIHGKYVSLNGKLIELTDDKSNFKVVDVEALNAKLRQNESKPAIDLKYVSYDKFHSDKLGRDLTRYHVLNNLKRGLHITIDGKELAITPDGLDFGYLYEIEAMKNNLKPMDEVNKEAQEANIKIINAPIKLKNYFADDVILEEPGEETEQKETDASHSYQAMRKLQKRLFYLSADSNMVNVDSAKAQATFDFVYFANEYEKAVKGEKNTLARLFDGDTIAFDLSGENQTSRRLWKQIVKFESAVKDTFKEMGDDYLNIGYPSVSDVVYEDPNNPDSAIAVNAPLFLIKAKLVLNPKDKSFNLLLARERSELVYKANKELLLYLTTKLNRPVNLSKYKVLFDDGNPSFEEQVKAMKNFFADINVSFDDAKILSIKDNNKFSEFNQAKIDEVTKPKLAKKSTKANSDEAPTFSKTPSTNKPAMNIQKEGITITANCFLGIFKTLNSEIFKDYDVILKSKTGQEFHGELDALIPDQLDYYRQKGKDFKEADLRQIVPLDYSQKTACKLALTNSINIVGPAGTGKSQTISNIFANFIDKHESALFVAEKKTATDVVFNRLKNLRFYVLPLYNKENWNENLTKALRQTLIRVGTIYGSWDALELDDSENREEHASKSLDDGFETMKKHRKLMSTQNGYELPKLTIEFSQPDKHQLIQDVETLVPVIFNNSSSAPEFWAQINKVKNEKNLYEGVTSILESIKDPEIKGIDELKNKFLQICRYYDSPTLYDKEMVMILQEEYQTNLHNFPDDYDKQAAESFKKTDPLYQKFLDLMIATKTADSGTLKLLKEQDGYITVSFLNSLKAKFDKVSAPVITTAANGQNQSMQIFTDPGTGKQFYIQNGQMIPLPDAVQSAPRKDPIQEFAEKYNESTFNFDLIKHYLDLKINWKQHQDSSVLNLDTVKWFNGAIDDLNKKLTTDLSYTELNFLRYVKNQINSNMIYAAQYNKLYGIVDNNTKLENIDEILKQYGAIIALLFPIVIASPDLVAKYLNPVHGLFDHAVIDEASMLSLEKAIPILYRGKKYVIVGDSKQLQPLSYLEQLKKLDNYKKLYRDGKIKKEELTLQRELVKTYKGVLDFMSPHVQKTTLQYHYRAAKTELVKFSSVAFYDNEMIIGDNFSNKPTYLSSGLTVQQVNGDYKDGINKEECYALYNKLVEIARKNRDILDKTKKISVGVIVFSPEQKEFLDTLIAQKADPDVQAMQMLYNVETGEDSSLFIKDVESVQGDERDVILMSLGSSSHNKPELVKSLGLLNTDLGPNFLNVMATRARCSMCIFKSFVAEDIPNTGNPAVNYYKDFIKYIDLLVAKSNGDDKAQSQIDNLFKEYEIKSATIDYSSLTTNTNASYLCQTIFNKFAEHIDQTKYKIIQDFEPINGQKLGLVALDKQTNIPEFALIFDDYLKNIYKTAKQSQFYDFLFLDSRGWKINKITALEWADLLDKANISKTPDEMITNFIREKLTFKEKVGTNVKDVCYYIAQQPVVEQPVEEKKKDIFEETLALSNKVAEKPVEKAANPQPKPKKQSKKVSKKVSKVKPNKKITKKESKKNSKKVIKVKKGSKNININIK